MSLFKTTISVDVPEFENSLPDRSKVLSVKFDKKIPALVIEWDDPNEDTGYSFAVERKPDTLVEKKSAKKKKDK